MQNRGVLFLSKAIFVLRADICHLCLNEHTLLHKTDVHIRFMRRTYKALHNEVCLKMSARLLQ